MKGQWILVYALILGLLLALLVGLNPISSLAADRGSGADSLVSEEAAMLEAPTLAEAAHEGVDADWWSAVQEHIRRSEYQVTWQEQTYLEDVAAAYQAPNRAENLRTYFAPQGPIVIPRVWGEETASPPWRWQASLVAWGRAGALRPVSPAQLRVEENRIEYQREGLVEWYRNDEEGLEQGFTLPSAPEGGEAGQPLQLALALAGDMVPEMILEGAGIEFRTAEGDDGLRYGRLRAVDAAGQSLPARLELQGATLSIWVEDAGAAYPIEVDPTIRGLLPDPYWSITFGSLVAEYGSSVGTAGDVNGDGYSDVIVGVPGYDGGLANQGQAYVYHGSRDGLGVVPEWYKGIGQAGAHFGAEVATAGDVNGDGYADVIIGAPEYTGNTGHEEEGGIWVYHGSADGLEDDYATHDEGNQADARFGHSVATAGDVNGDGYADVIVGAPLFASPTLEEGRVWVWHGSEDGLSEYHNWRAESNQAESGFGVSASTAGDINGDGYADVIVGAHRYRVPDAEYGVVFIWLGSADGVNGGENGTPGNAHQDRVLWDSGARFGHSVSTAGDVNGDGYADVIVGAPFYDDGPSEEGAAFLYLGSDSGIDGNYVNMDQGGKVGARLGWTVATAGDVNGDGYADVIVGAPDNSIFNPGEPGRAFVWHGQPTSTGISTTRDWDAEGEEADARFGFSVGTAGDVDGDGYSDIIVGSPGNAVSAGSAYVYHGRPDDVSEEAGWIRASNKEDALFGHSVGSAGDVNGDGYADVVVGAPGWDGGQMLEGEALVYLGSADGLETVPNWYKQSNKTLAKFGTSAGTAGDVNGDGYDDIIVGAPGWHNPETDEGAAWVYHGSNTGVETTSSWGVASNGTGAKFGTSVGTAGDVNGDGYSDVVVGAPFWQQGGEERGAAFIYHGTENGLHTSSDTYLPGDQADAEYGHAVGTAGDVNRDGYSDVIVGAPKWDGSNLREGHAWVYHGSRRGLQRTPRWDEGGSKFNAQYGFAVGTAGDVNGDGYADIIVGAPYWYDDHVDEGKVWVYHGSSMGLGATSSWRKEGGQTGAHYGYSVGTAGDVNGDGIADVIIGVEGWNGGQTNEGGASLYHGSYGGLEQSRSWHGEGDQVNAYYGTSVGTAGDVNGDGYADVIVGAPKRQRSGGPGDEGQAFLYYGNGGRGVALRPVQEQEDDSPLAHLGRLSTWDSFLVFVLPESPFGRGGMALEVEAKPLGVPFDGSGTVRWMAYWVHAPGQAGSVLVDNLIPDMPYHWRVRWRYDPATTPWLPASRWMTNPWNGWQETDFRTGGGRIMLPLALGNYD